MKAPRIGLVLAALLLAGCAEGPAPAPSTVPTSVVVTSLDDADSLTNATFMNASHLHDYWGGASEIVVLDLRLPADHVTLGGGGLDYPFRAEPGHVVPQGTSRVVVTAAWELTDTSRVAGAELWVQRPREHDPQRVGEIDEGVPVTVPTTEQDADVPHQQLSSWVFDLRFQPGADGVTLAEGEVALKVVAHRGLEIPLFPPHPDHWNGKDAITLLEEDVDFAVWDGSAPDGYRCYAMGCPQVHRPPNGTVVPYDAKWVEVVLTRKDPSVDTMGLRYHGGDSRNHTAIPPTKEEGAVRTYRIEVSGLKGDGPYAAQSLWEIVPYIEAPQEDFWHAGAYHIVARALRD